MAFFTQPPSPRVDSPSSPRAAGGGRIRRLSDLRDITLNVATSAAMTRVARRALPSRRTKCWRPIVTAQMTHFIRGLDIGARRARFALPFVVLTTALLPSLAACSDPAPAPALADFGALRDVADAPEPLRKAADAVVLIETDDHSGTGMFIAGDGRLLTNNHVLGAGTCAREGCFVTLTLHHERRPGVAEEAITAFARPLLINPELDLALVQIFHVKDGAPTTPIVPDSSVTFTPRSAESLVGTRIHVIGHPDGRLKKWSTGDVVGVSGRWLSTTAFVLPGSSGSPMVDDDGNVVGIVHRVSQGGDLLTPDGVNDESIGSASRDILAALEATDEAADGLGLLRTVDGAATRADVVRENAVWLAAHRTAAMVDGVGTSVLGVLAEACDAALSTPRFPSVDAFDEAMQPCFAARLWIGCYDAETTGKVCPDGDAADAWRTRFRQAGDAIGVYNTSWMLAFRTRAVPSLEQNEESARAAAQRELWDLLATRALPLDLTLAAALAYTGTTMYGRVQVASYLRDYTKVPHYELDAYSLMTGLLWMNFHGYIDGPVVLTAVRSLLDDARLDLGAHLYVEEIAVRNKVIQ